MLRTRYFQSYRIKPRPESLCAIQSGHVVFPVQDADSMNPNGATKEGSALDTAFHERWPRVKTYPSLISYKFKHLVFTLTISYRSFGLSKTEG